MTDMTIPKWPSMERALMQLLLDKFTWQDEPLDEGNVGGDFAFDSATQPWYIRIDRVGGRSNRLEGDFILDLEVFGPEYALTDSIASALDALVLGYPHVVEVDGQKVVFDKVTQNELPDDRPWEDDSVTRLGATYVITARRR